MALIGSINVIAQASKINIGTVIFLHGSGDTGYGVLEWIKMLLGKNWGFPHLKVVFPTAPLQPYTPLNGALSNVWFDRQLISPRVPEQLESIDSMAKQLCDLIDKEVDSGIPLNKIIVGGFSMGGAMALHVGYRFRPQIAGVFALSSFLNSGSAVYESIPQQKETSNLPELFMCHGERDDLVPLKAGQETFQKLMELGVKGEFLPLRNTLHELKRNELENLCSWIERLLPNPTNSNI